MTYLKKAYSKKTVYTQSNIPLVYFDLHNFNIRKLVILKNVEEIIAFQKEYLIRSSFSEHVKPYIISSHI